MRRRVKNNKKRPMGDTDIRAFLIELYAMGQQNNAQEQERSRHTPAVADEHVPPPLATPLPACGWSALGLALPFRDRQRVMFDQVGQFFRVRTTLKQKVSLTDQREVFRHQLEALSAMVLVA
jgi:hypothetical protein